MAKDVSAIESKTEDKKLKKREKNVVPTKLVIRRLPPYLTEDELLEVISPLPDHDYFRYVKGDGSLAPENYCRAYINFTSPDVILAFRDKVDGLEFVDSKGNSQPCVLEYAPCQKTPRKTKKRDDAKVGTLDEDPEYKEFLESLQAEEEKIVIDLEKYLEELEKKEQKHKHIETPLTAFLKQKREERKRIRDERRRIEQEKRKKRDEERRREAEKRKKLDAEKARKKKEEEKRKVGKKDEGKKDAKEEESSREDQKEDSKGSSDKKSEVQGKGDGKQQNKGKFEATDRTKTGPRLSDTKPKKADREPIRRGPIGSKPKDSEENGERERGKTNFGDRDRPSSNYGRKESRGGYDRGGYSGRGSRGRGYRGGRDFPPRKWDYKNDDMPPRARGKSVGEDVEKKIEKNKSKRPDREIYRPGSSRGSAPKTEGSSRPHKYSEQRSRSRQDEEK